MRYRDIFSQGMIQKKKVTLELAKPWYEKKNKRGGENYYLSAGEYQTFIENVKNLRSNEGVKPKLGTQRKSKTIAR